jgi:hypothetical protein
MINICLGFTVIASFLYFFTSTPCPAIPFLPLVDSLMRQENPLTRFALKCKLTCVRMRTLPFCTGVCKLECSTRSARLSHKNHQCHAIGGMITCCESHQRQTMCPLLYHYKVLCWVWSGDIHIDLNNVSKIGSIFEFMRSVIIIIIDFLLLYIKISPAFHLYCYQLSQNNGQQIFIQSFIFSAEMYKKTLPLRLLFKKVPDSTDEFKFGLSCLSLRHFR